jgi:hypothetical protein
MRGKKKAKPVWGGVCGISWSGLRSLTGVGLAYPRKTCRKPKRRAG